MRPKVVILILVVAFGLLGAIAVVKQLALKRADDQASNMPQPQATNPGTAPTNAAVAPAVGVSGVTPEVSDAMRAAVIAKEIDQIQELQGEVDGSNNPVIIAALLEKVKDPETEVRNAALEALKAINDTNAVPGLQLAIDAIKDFKGKAAAQDVIDYLNLPSVTDGIRPEDYTNSVTASSAAIPPDMKMNPKFLHHNHRNAQPTANSQPAPPADNTPAGQPQ